MKSDKELVERLEYEERLINRGYTKEKCSSCGGFGFQRTPDQHTCHACDGRGFHWRAPITK